MSHHPMFLATPASSPGSHQRSSWSSRSISMAPLALVIACGTFLGLSHHHALAQQGDALPAANIEIDPTRPYIGHSVIRLHVRTAQQLRISMTLADEVWNCRVGIGPVDLQVSPAKRQALINWAQQEGLTHEVFIADVQALLDDEARTIAAARLQRDAGWFNNYKELPQIHSRLDELAAASNGMATTFIAGQSLEGRDIKGIRITGPDFPGNPRATRPQIMFQGCQHAREWVSPPVNMWIADRFVEAYASDARIANLVNTFEFVIVPVINPDGYVFSWTAGNRLWRKNRATNSNGTRGVDLNRNWGYQWGGQGASTTPNNDTYRGPSAFSEPETQVMRDLITSLPRLKGHIDFHSYSQLILSPYGYTIDVPLDNPIFTILNNTMAQGIASIHGKTYIGGPSYTTIYPASGVVPDWVYGARGVPGWTIELRDTGQTGFVLPPEQIIPTAEENFEGVLRLSEYLRDNQLLIAQTQAPARLEPGTTGNVTILVKDNLSTLLPGSVEVHSRTGWEGTMSSTPMTLVDGYTFTAPLTAGACGLNIEYSFSALTSDGTRVTFPADGSVFGIPVNQRIVHFFDDMETDRGWSGSLPSDTATIGRWERADPEATSAQPADDASTPGTLCWITDGRAGAAVGTYDLDGGVTTLTSPRIDASLSDPLAISIETRLSYARWYSNNTGSAANADSMPVQLSYDDGATWWQVEECTQNAGAWVRTNWSMESTVPNASPTANVRVRFIARDLDAGSIVEAGIDDVSIERYICTPTGDFNADGGIDGQDIEAFFTAWEAGLPSADVDLNGGVDGQDVATFFIAWERG